MSDTSTVDGTAVPGRILRTLREKVCSLLSSPLWNHAKLGLDSLFPCCTSL